MEEYIDNKLKMKRSFKFITDDNLHCAVILGLRPDIKRHVIQQGPTTLEAVQKAAKAAEQAALATDDSNDPIAAAISRIDLRLI